MAEATFWEGTNVPTTSPRPEPVKKSLVEKLAEACDAVGGIEKRGTNQKQQYKYLKAADVAKAIRHEFFSRGIVITFDEKEFIQIRSIKTNAGGEMGEFLLKSEVTFCCGDEKLGPFGAFGVAMDTGDKAIWKAKTGALKYVLRGIGLIPDEKDDPEADEKVDKVMEEAQSSQYAQDFDQRTEGQRLVTGYHVAAWNSAAKKGVRSPAQIAAYLKAKGLTDIGGMMRDDFTEAIKWISNPDSGDLAQPLASSAKQANFAKLFALAGEKHVPEADVKQWCYETFRVDSMTKLTPLQVNDAMLWLKTLA